MREKNLKHINTLLKAHDLNEEKLENVYGMYSKTEDKMNKNIEKFELLTKEKEKEIKIKNALRIKIKNNII